MRGLSLPVCLAILGPSLWIAAVPAAVDAPSAGAALCRPLNTGAPSKPLSKQRDKQPGQLYLEADQADIREEADADAPADRQYHFSGQVLLERDEQVLRSEKLDYSARTGEVSAQGDVTLWDKGLIARSPQVTLHADATGTAEQAEYWLPARRGHGTAAKVERTGAEQARLQDMTYTTCDPGQEAWRLDSRDTLLDLTEDTGTAKGVTLRFHNVPILYTPYLSFPLSDRRKTGLLMPRVGYSKRRGLDLSLPYYWNLAPNYDATLTPRLMTERGLMLGTELRYLFGLGAGQLNWEYLDDDRNAPTPAERTRYLLKFKNLSRLSTGFYADLNYNEASDNRYFEDFGNSLDVSSTTHLEQRLDLGYQGAGYYALARAQHFQTLLTDPAARPYARLPQLLLGTQWPAQNRQWHGEATAEYVYFDRDTTLTPGPTGSRAHVAAALSYPWRTPGIFLVPRLAVQTSRYSLNDTTAGAPTDPSRTLYTLSLDSGLFLERHTSWRDTGLVQTLEPRLFYVYTPYQDQSQIPVFDSGLYDFSFSQLFRENRFSGSDRISDENRIALALTSRFLDRQDGTEYLRGSLGQTYALEDPQVSLPGQVLATDSASHVVGEIAARLDRHWQASQTVQWDLNNNQVIKSTSQLRYQASEQGAAVNLSYRLRHDLLEDLEQTDISGDWPLNRQWRAVARWNYSLANERHLETLAGIEYNSCCWALRLVARRYLQNLAGDYDTGLYLQIELKGLAGVGRSAGSFLQNAMPGFNDRLSDHTIAP